MANIVQKLTNQEIQQLMTKIDFNTTNLSQGMKDGRNIVTPLLRYTILIK